MILKKCPQITSRNGLFNMPSTLINDAEYYYEKHGMGLPLVLVAGLTCDLSFWYPLVEHLEDYFELLIFDNRGVGRTKYPNQSFSIADLARDVVSLMTELGFDKPHILGHSMGGCIVQAIAHNHRELVNKIIISNSLIKFRKGSVLFEKFMLKMKESGASVEQCTEAALPWLLSDSYLANDQNIQNFIQAQVQTPFPQSLLDFKRQLDALLAFDSSSWYKNIKGPALIIGADEDILCPYESEKLANGIEDAKFIDFHRVGHILPIEKPKDLAAIISNYLN